MNLNKIKPLKKALEGQVGEVWLVHEAGHINDALLHVNSQDQAEVDQLRTYFKSYSILV